MVKKSFHTGTVKKTVTIKTPKDKVWRQIQIHFVLQRIESTLTQCCPTMERKLQDGALH
jgi:hypothetical protein